MSGRLRYWCTFVLAIAILAAAYFLVRGVASIILALLGCAVWWVGLRYSSSRRHAASQDAFRQPSNAVVQAGLGDRSGMTPDGGARAAVRCPLDEGLRTTVQGAAYRGDEDVSGTIRRRPRDMRRFIRVVALAAVIGTTAGAGATLGVGPSRSAAPLPPPTFLVSAGWVTANTGPSSTRTLPQAWAVTPQSNFPSALNLFAGLRNLSRGGIVIWAMSAGRGGPTHAFKASGWPLRLSSFRVDHAWEGQPSPNVQQRLSWTAIHGWHLDVRLYFATQHPSRALVRRAQGELRRLRLP
jgi:hypothetical protein